MARVVSSVAGKYFEFTSGLQKRLKLSKLETLLLTSVYLSKNIIKLQLFIIEVGEKFL